VTVQCLNGRAPPYLSDYCAPVASADRRHLRSTNCQLLAVPRYWLNTYGRRAFSVADFTVWNSLPNFIWDPTISSDCFRRLLKRICSLNTSAFSALEVLTTTALYKFTYLLTFLLSAAHLTDCTNRVSQFLKTVNVCSLNCTDDDPHHRVKYKQ